MKTAIIILALLATSTFAQAQNIGGIMYQYTFTTKTQKCAVDIFVPTKGDIKIEKICFKITK